MANRYVRVYQGPENTNVIGFSFSAAPERADDFEGFMEAKGYQVEPFSLYGEAYNDRHAAIIRALGGVSAVYYGIEPPLQSAHYTDVVEWCDEHVYTGNNSGYLIDNRMTPPPLQPFHNDNQRILGKW